MKVWLVKLGEVFWTQGSGGTPGRMGLLAKSLVDAGHEVVYWAATFSHSDKAQLFDSSGPQVSGFGFAYHLAHVPGYRKNMSVDRICHHWRAARYFSVAMRAETIPPDIIVCAYPTAENAAVAINYGREFGVPVILDVRDLWPDIFSEVLPQSLQPLGKWVFWPFFFQARQVFSKCNYVTGITDAMLDWGLTKAGRPRRALERPFYLATGKVGATSPNKQFVENLNLTSNCPVVVFFGTFSRRIELDTVVQAIKLAEERGAGYQFVLCGNGERFDELQSDLTGYANAHLPGRVGRPELAALMEVASVGILPYPSTSDFSRSIPNKVGDYLSGGIPVLSSIKGEMEKFLEENQCGKTYRNNDPEDLLENLGTMIGDQEDFEAMRKAAMASFYQHLDAEQVYRDMVKWLEEIFAEYKSQRG